MLAAPAGQAGDPHLWSDNRRCRSQPDVGGPSSGMGGDAKCHATAGSAPHCRAGRICARSTRRAWGEVPRSLGGAAAWCGAADVGETCCGSACWPDGAVHVRNAGGAGKGVLAVGRERDPPAYEVTGGRCSAPTARMGAACTFCVMIASTVASHTQTHNLAHTVSARSTPNASNRPL
jgi:hypothetical protein